MSHEHQVYEDLLSSRPHRERVLNKGRERLNVRPHLEPTRSTPPPCLAGGPTAFASKGGSLPVNVLLHTDISLAYSELSALRLFPCFYALADGVLSSFLVQFCPVCDVCQSLRKRWMSYYMKTMLEA